MEKIKNNSKETLEKLWKLASGNKNYFKLNNDDTFMPLTVEIIAKNQISICHYGEQNGDLMRDPEMIFWKDENGDYFPFYFRNDYVGYEEISGEMTDDKIRIFNLKRQKSQVEFANMWLVNILHQQNL